MKRAVGAAVLALMVLTCACGLSSVRVTRVTVPPEGVRRGNELSRQGDELLGRQEFYPALLKYLEAIENNPNSEVALNKAAIVYTKLNLYSQANKAVHYALGLNPKYAFAYNTLGTLHMVQGEYGRATKNFRKAIALRPSTAFFYKNLGTALFERGEFDEGMQAYRKALELDPNVLAASAGINVESQALRDNTADREFFFARLHALYGNIARAVEHIRKALDAGLNINKVLKEKDFEAILKTEEFRNLLQERGLALATATEDREP